MDRMNLAEFTEPEIFVDTNIFVYAIRFIKEHPNVISECSVAYSALDDVFDSSVVILPFTLEVLQQAKTLSKKHNLLFSDAIHAASCKVYGIKHIATNDSDFERVDFLKNWRP